MKKRYLAASSALLLTLLFAAGCAENKGTKEYIVPEGYTNIRLEESTGVTVDGIGVEMDPHFFSQNVVRNVSGLTADKWSIVESRVKRMGVDKFRVMVLPQWLEPVNDNGDAAKIDWSLMTKDSLEMQSLKKTLDLAQEAGIDVTLVLWGVPTATTLAADNYRDKPYFMGQNHTSVKNWVVAPKGEMEEEFCENFSAYIQYLVVEEGYSCITEVTPINEPNWSYQVDGAVDVAGYVRLCRKLDARFKADGIRDLVKFNLVDSDRDHNDIMTAVADNIPELGQVTNAHTYAFGYDTKNSAIVEWARQDYAMSNSFSGGHFIGEFGSNQTVGSTVQRDIATYERGVLMARLMLNFFNGGACGMSYWSLFDQYNGAKASYGQMMQTGLWYSAKEEYASDKAVYDLVKEDFAVKKQYYAFSLLTKHVARGSEVYPVVTGDEFMAGSKFVSESGTVYAFANGGSGSHKLAFQAEEGSRWETYVYAEDALPAGDALIESSRTITATDLCVSFEVPANTVVLIKSK